MSLREEKVKKKRIVLPLERALVTPKLLLIKELRRRKLQQGHLVNLRSKHHLWRHRHNKIYSRRLP